MNEISFTRNTRFLSMPAYIGTRASIRSPSVTLLVGIAVGVLVGTYSDKAALTIDMVEYFAALAASIDMLAALKESFNFFMLAIAFSTSYLGFLFIPALTAVRGYLYGLNISVLFLSFSYKGLLGAAFICGVPMLLTFVPFLLICSDSYLLSQQLFVKRFGRSGAFDGISFLRHLLLSLPLITLCFIYYLYFLPDILYRFFC